MTICFVLAGEWRYLAKAPRDVVLSASITRRGEQFARGVELDELPEIHEGGEVGYTRRLLHVVRHNHDRVMLLELVDQFLDLCGGDRVERRARLVEQNHLGLDCNGAGDAEPLLLAAGEAQSIGPELVLDLVPERSTPQRGLDPAIHFRAREPFVE